jgi:hypothetical protein
MAEMGKTENEEFPDSENLGKTGRWPDLVIS